ncbi:MAG: rhamnan synthesis F family protein [Lachnospiraceae bacterium]|nr:rhamnan synthesis F family protein [Lachnospiraceae bacterium]
MKRLGIFIFYDKDGIVDDYVIYLLDKMRECWDDLVIISNGYLEATQSDRLRAFTDLLIMRENWGLDAGAIRDFFLNQSVVKLSDYDELFWFNDTCYGPFFSMKSIFDAMSEREDVHFWGLIDQINSDVMRENEFKYAKWIQTFFVAVKSKMFLADCFLDFWKNLAFEDDYLSVVTHYEMPFTEYFENHGFQYDVFCDYKKWLSHNKHGVNYSVHFPYELLTGFHFPLLKRKAFSLTLNKLLVQNDGNDMALCLEYIRDHTDYPLDYIYKNLKRKYSQTELEHCLGFKFIVDARDNGENDNYRIFAYIDSDYEASCAIAHFKLAGIDPGRVSFMVTGDKMMALIQEALPSYEVVRAEKMTFLDFFSFVSAQLKTEDYACLIYNKKSGSELPNVDGVRYRNTYWNLVQNAHYINNVMDVFKRNPWIGKLGAAKHTLSAEKTGKVDSEERAKINKLCDDFGKYKYCDDYRFENFDRCELSMWIKADLLQAISGKLVTLPKVDSQTFELALYYIIQNYDCFSGVVIHDLLAKRELTNTQFFHQLSTPLSVKMLEEERVKKKFV